MTGSLMIYISSLLHLARVVQDASVTSAGPRVPATSIWPTEFFPSLGFELGQGRSWQRRALAGWPANDAPSPGSALLMQGGWAPLATPRSVHVDSASSHRKVAAWCADHGSDRGLGWREEVSPETQ